MLYDPLAKMAGLLGRVQTLSYINGLGVYPYWSVASVARYGRKFQKATPSRQKLFVPPALPFKLKNRITCKTSGTIARRSNAVSLRVSPLVWGQTLAPTLRRVFSHCSKEAFLRKMEI